MATRRNRVGEIITHQIPLSHFLEAYQRLNEGKESMIKVLLVPDNWFSFYVVTLVQN
jgi:threonine dehydrogenase-like Zn-dependent dehydrogenase